MLKWIKALAGTLVCSALVACGGGGSNSSVTPQIAPPSQVVSLSVQPGDAVNTIEWPAVVTATSYDLYWSDTTPVTKEAAHVIRNAVSPYLHTGLQNGKTIYYAVVAVGDGGESELSSEIGAMPVAPIPEPPTVLNAVPGDTMTTLDWSPVAGATSYDLYWSLSPDPTPGASGVTQIPDIVATSYTHTGLTNGSTYYYVVTSVNTGGESAASASASATPLPPAPGAPANMTATSGDTAVQLAWSASSDATSYNLYWSATPGVTIGGAGVNQVTGITSTSYSATGLTNGTTYYFAVTSVGPGGESALSNEIAGRPLPPTPPAPLGITAIAPKDTAQVTLQWYDVTDYPTSTAPIQVHYNIYRGLQPGVASYFGDSSRATKIADVTAPFTDSTVTKATTYYYVVTSFVPGFPEVESAPSGEVSATVSRSGGGGGSGGGEETSTYANNLSFPLVFADGYGITGAKITGSWQGVGPFQSAPAFDFNTGLRPLSTETLSAFPYYDAKTQVSLGGVVYNPQASPSAWQAEWRNNAAGQNVPVIIDWGDALASKSYTGSSMVRIETVLKQDGTVPGVSDTMTAYKMALLSGQQTTELQGTDGTTYASATRNVFAINGRLKIEKVATDGGPDIVVYDKAIYQGFGATEEGSGSGGSKGGSSAYAAEINAAGAVVYGYNFRLSSVTGVPQKTGQYRLTFSLDPQATVGADTVPNHVTIVNKADATATVAPDGLSSSILITVN